MFTEARKFKGATARDGSSYDRKAVVERFTEKWFNTTTRLWADAYVDAERADRAPALRANTRTTPFLASPDAAYPFYLEAASGEISIHHENNIAPCAQYVNLSLNTWLKGNLQVARDALDLWESDYSAYADVNNRFDNYWAIRGKIPHRQRDRLKITMNEADYQRCCDEWREGLLADADEIVPYYIDYQAPSNSRKGADGAPFPWRPEHMPPDWSYELLEGNMAYHFRLMDKWCDKYFTTEESPETIFLEVLWQWFDNGGRDVFLRLPMTVMPQHATGFALGHLHHGNPMRTGWPIDVEITDHSQRDGSRCNVLVETRISNLMKADYSETEYQAIRNDLQHCRDDTEWFTRPQGPVPPINVQRTDARVTQRRSKQWMTAGSQADVDAGDDLDDEVDPAELPDDFADIADDFAEDEAVL
ncbi:hypothetical protein LTR48_003371 [Friedmanniomyces endolithicus]|uniref:HNH nuclease domain-containing protein n=1 Tax=Rachicladosporium monterosium TaxID=1507873 RepID=A0ABR0L7R9_9PEZI|nr:hypothetical protein LTR48_003371 [Friedmanniomyces endolithicus]KAK5144822.1 hypothetical protein LTR32_003307 [Rachicladosporium monterosium]